METNSDFGPPRVLVLRAPRLFDGAHSTMTSEPVVVIANGRVTAVQSRYDPLPVDASIVDLPGATLLPGLIDSHLHLCFDASEDPVGHLALMDRAMLLEHMAAAARRALRAGVTTVRDLGDREYAALELRGRSTGPQPLPTIVASGPPITSPGGHCHFLGGEVDGLDSARAAVRERAERGVEVIKVMASGGNMAAGPLPFEPQFGVDFLRAVVDEAHRRGLPVTAHAHSARSIADAVAAGVDGIEHATFMTATGVDAREAVIRSIVERRIAVGATVGREPGTSAAPPPAIASRFEALLAARRRLHAAGALVVGGSDAGVATGKPHDVLRYAPEDLTEMGMTPVETLWALTSRAAEVCGLGHRKGRVAPGFDADLLAIDGDPVEDLTAIRRIRAVFVGGQSVALHPAGSKSIVGNRC